MCGEPHKFGSGLFPREFMKRDQQAQPGMSMDQTFDEMWQSYLDFDADPQAWSAIFADIDMNAVVP
jgi:hypothetical protein